MAYAKNTIVHNGTTYNPGDEIPSGEFEDSQLDELRASGSVTDASPDSDEWDANLEDPFADVPNANDPATALSANAQLEGDNIEEQEATTAASRKATARSDRAGETSAPEQKDVKPSGSDLPDGG